MSAIPSWLADANEEERAELAALGLIADVESAPIDQAQRDARASQLLRALGRVEAEIEERKAAQHAEVMQIAAIYERELDRLRRHASFIVGGIHALAMESDFGKKKSRTVGFGTYGRRSTPLKVDVQDESATLEWARAHLPEAVRAKTTLTVDAVMRITDAGLGELVPESALKWELVKTPITAHVKATGDDEIPGAVVRLPEEQPFCEAFSPKDGVR
jgi:phage host-nuclease inhibitor protein Gam